MDKKWYIVNVQTGCEATAKTAIEERIKSNKMEPMFGEILIPAENVVELVKGQKTTKSRKFFPGYIFVNMVLSDQTWHLVKNSSKVGGFVGSGTGTAKTRPPEVPEGDRGVRVGRQEARAGTPDGLSFCTPPPTDGGCPPGYVLTIQNGQQYCTPVVLI